jgi:hypothetical protein
VASMLDSILQKLGLSQPMAGPDVPVSTFFAPVITSRLLPVTTTLAASTSGVLLLTRNPQRTAASIFNGANTTLYLVFDRNPAISNYSIKLLPNGLYELPSLGASGVYTGDLWGIWDGIPAGNARVSEMT